jgi:hypothetical protein
MFICSNVQQGLLVMIDDVAVRSNRMIYTALLAFALLGGWMYAPAPGQSSEDATGWNEPRVILEGKPGDERDIGTVELMYPFSYSPESLWFADIRGRFANNDIDGISDDDSFEGNLGVGYRRATDGNDSVFGLYGYLDHLETPFENEYQQLTVGGEYFYGKNWLGRINGYLPEDDEQSVPVSVANTGRLQNGQIQFVDRTLEENSLPGADVEIGRRFTPFNQRLWLYGGYFFFDRSGYEEVEGPRVRAEATWDVDALASGADLTAGVEYQDDDVRDEQIFGLLRIDIPFGTRSDEDTSRPDWVKNRLSRRVKRDVDIVTGQDVETQTTTASTEISGSDVELNQENVKETDAQGVQSASDEQGGNGVLLVDGGSLGEGGSVTLDENGQLVLGGGSSLEIKNRSTGDTTHFNVPGDRPYLSDINVPANAVELQNVDGNNLAVNGDDVTSSNLQLNGEIQTSAGNSFQNLTLANTTVGGWNNTTVNGTFSIDRIVQPDEAIQPHIDGASSGEQIGVAPGTYNGSLTIGKDGIGLQSFAPRQATIVGDGVGTGSRPHAAVHVASNGGGNDPVQDVSIQGFTIQNPNGTYGIFAGDGGGGADVSGLVVASNRIEDIGTNLSESDTGWGSNPPLTGAISGFYVRADYSRIDVRDNTVRNVSAPSQAPGRAAGLSFSSFIGDTAYKKETEAENFGYARNTIVTDNTVKNISTPSGRTKGISASGEFDGVVMKGNNVQNVDGVNNRAIGIGLTENPNGPDIDGDGKGERIGPRNFVLSQNNVDNIKTTDDGFSSSLFVGGFEDLGDNHRVTRNNFLSGAVERFAGQQDGYQIGDGDVLDARENYYGASDGPSGDGSGNGVPLRSLETKDKIDFQPFLSEPVSLE